MNNKETKLEMGMVLELKKEHPSKTKTWTIVMLGTDVKLKSNDMPDTYILLKRSNLLKRIKKIM